MLTVKNNEHKGRVGCLELIVFGQQPNGGVLPRWGGRLLVCAMRYDVDKMFLQTVEQMSAANVLQTVRMSAKITFGI